MPNPPFHGRLTKFHPRHFLVEIIKARDIISFFVVFIFIAFEKLLINRSVSLNFIVIRLFRFF